LAEPGALQFAGAGSVHKIAEADQEVDLSLPQFGQVFVEFGTGFAAIPGA